MSAGRSDANGRRLLVANRGEIALRVVHAARSMGLETVTVWSAEDRDAPHAHAGDRGVALDSGPADAGGYLDARALLAAAERSGADAVHPGYGFLSENADFATTCVDAGLLWVGPDPATLRNLGDKAAAKRTMQAAGVPVLGGRDVAVGDDGSFDPGPLDAVVDEVGLPLLVKAVAGGGGRGLRRVVRRGDLADALAGAASEGRASFGDGRLMLEPFLERARHVEVQILGDRHGTVLHLGERDCSAQRRHQKIIEESPSPFLTPDLRQRLCQAAVTAGHAVGYVGAGTVEMLVAPDGRFFFLEVNTRLQVEHGVTELRFGIDLVTWQLRVALGAALDPALQPRPDSALGRHVIEARLYAEDADRGFLPSPGRVLRWRPPANARAFGDPPEDLATSLRIDHALADGGDVTDRYDPMVAKILAAGRDRDEARRRLDRALAATVLLGPTTNRRFLRRLLDHAVFRSGDVHTTWVEDHVAAEEPAASHPSPSLLAVAAVLLSEARVAEHAPAALDDPLWGWRSHAGTEGWTVPVRVDGAADAHPVRLVPAAWHGSPRDGRSPRDAYRVRLDTSDVHRLEIVDRTEPILRFLWDGTATTIAWCADPETGELIVEDLESVHSGATARVSWTRREGTQGNRDDPSTAMAPMAGRIRDVRVAVGDPVEIGSLLMVLEAMKLETRIEAGCAGTVVAVNAAADDQVARGDVLVRIEPRQSRRRDAADTPSPSEPTSANDRRSA